MIQDERYPAEIENEFKNDLNIAPPKRCPKGSTYGIPMSALNSKCTKSLWLDVTLIKS